MELSGLFREAESFRSRRLGPGVQVPGGSAGRRLGPLSHVSPRSDKDWHRTMSVIDLSHSYQNTKDKSV